SDDRNARGTERARLAKPGRSPRPEPRHSNVVAFVTQGRGHSNVVALVMRTSRPLDDVALVTQGRGTRGSPRRGSSPRRFERLPRPLHP
ncbi:MAG TPA: hypothetical protein VH142_20530, partial [Polyangiaceae bacterium]|nr:hypothetical protein [Polyangiaceae bacterium]